VSSAYAALALVLLPEMTAELLSGCYFVDVEAETDPAGLLDVARWKLLPLVPVGTFAVGFVVVVSSTGPVAPGDSSRRWA
jgi:hypothetical protein